MDRLSKIKHVRTKLKSKQVSLGSWIQIPNSSVAEIMGDAGYDWVAVDLEHGGINHSQLSDLFRAIEIKQSLSLVRLAEGSAKDCKQALDAGAGGVIVPMVETQDQLKNIRSQCCWPPKGRRGVGFSRANLFGKYFKNYRDEAQQPLLVAMIETQKGLENLKEILSVDGLDAILVGPYDLSASLGVLGDFENPKFVQAIQEITKLTLEKNIGLGIHVVQPDQNALKKRITEGFNFIAYSIDSVFIVEASQNPLLK